MAITPVPELVWLNTASADCPPDEQIAVSGEKDKFGGTHNQFVALSTNTALQVFYKNGNLFWSQSYKEFFKSSIVDTGDPITSHALQWDARILFDHYRRRFIVLHGAGNSYLMTSEDVWKKVRGRWYVSVSKTENPTGEWWHYVWDAVSQWGSPGFWQPGDISDYPCIGIGPSAFLVCNQVYNRPHLKPADKALKYTYVIIADAKSLAAGTDPGNWWGWNVFTDPDGKIFSGVIQPARHYGQTDNLYFVGVYDQESVLVWQLTKPFGNGQLTSVRVPITGGQYGGALASPPPADQPGSDKLLDIPGNIVLDAVYRNKNLYFVCQDAGDWFGDGRVGAAIRLVRLDVSNYPKIPAPPASGSINRRFGRNSQTPPADDPKAVVHYGVPSLAVNKNGDMLIGYTRSGKSAGISPQARISAYYAAESDIRGSNLLQAGQGPYTQCSSSKKDVVRWGDISGTCVDPIDDTTFWVANQYATAGGAYGIAIGKVLL
jgi:hypothetical protein